MVNWRSGSLKLAAFFVKFKNFGRGEKIGVDFGFGFRFWRGFWGRFWCGSLNWGGFGLNSFRCDWFGD